MFTYPHLTPTEQACLPPLTAQPAAIPNRFEDSTHQLFDCKTTQGDMVLKVCNTAILKDSHFWQAANHLFAADFPNSLGSIDLTHRYLEKHGTLIVPEFVAAANRFVLTRFLVGTDLDSSQVNDTWVIALAEHIAKLHQCHFKHWGTLHAPQFEAQAWTDRLHHTLLQLIQPNNHDHAWLLSEIIMQAKEIHETDFVPVMLDLRWDQFRVCTPTNSNTHTLALIDLDAFVIAPRALDLVLLAYVLTPAQLDLFKQHYTKTHCWLEHNAHTRCYQLLLFLMNILGESDLRKWMRRI